MRKKLIALACVLCFSFALTACGSSENNENAQGTGTPTATVTEQPTETPTSTPEPTEQPTETPTPEPTEEPTETPTPEPTEEPTETPTPEPTETPTQEAVHEHSYTETIIVEGTCTTWGTKRYTCSCGDSYEKEYALDHVSDGNRVMVVEPNCTSEGISAEHCIHCGERLYAELASGTTAHIPNSYWSCYTPTGDYYLSCSICNHVITHTTTRPEGVEIREYSDVDSSTLQPVN